MLDCLAVALGGALGSVLRYLIGLIQFKEQTLFPIKTFAINVLGCFLIGLIAALSLKSSNLNPRLVLFLKVGICGGFTTFSTFALESSNLLKNGHPGIAALYMFLSIAVGIGFVLLAELNYLFNLFAIFSTSSVYIFFSSGGFNTSTEAPNLKSQYKVSCI